MKRYETVQEYVDSIYDHLYLRGKKAVDALNEKGEVTKFDLIDKGVAASQTARAIRDLKDHGIPIVTKGRINTNRSKNPMVLYCYGKVADINSSWGIGRDNRNYRIKDELMEKYGNHCAFCGRRFNPSELQVDHRLPLKYFGDHSYSEDSLEDYLLVCARCNRLKNTAVDQCAKTCYKTGDWEVIKSCYWYNPFNYSHICMRPIRRQVLDFEGNEVNLYNDLMQIAKDKEVNASKVMMQAMKEYADKHKKK